MLCCYFFTETLSLASPFFSPPLPSLTPSDLLLWTGAHIESSSSPTASPQVGVNFPINQSFWRGSVQTNFDLVDLNLSNVLLDYEPISVFYSLGSHLGSGGSLSPWLALNSATHNLSPDLRIFLSGGMFLGSFSMNRSVWDVDLIQNTQRSYFYYFGTQAHVGFFPDPRIGINIGFQWIPWTRFANLSSPIQANINFMILF